MKVAINASFLVPKGGGIKEYIKNLINNLAGVSTDLELVVYVSAGMTGYAKSILTDGVNIKETPYAHGEFWSTIKRSLFEQRFWQKEEIVEKFDVFHSPFFHAPKMKKAKVLITVHDLRFFRFPKTYGFLRYHFIKYKVPCSLRYATHIITISDFTKSELIEAYNLSPDKITAIHESINGGDFSFEGKKLTKTEDINIAKELRGRKLLLSVGHIEPRKNYERLVMAFKKVRESVNDAHLVIVGKPNLDAKNTIQMIDSTENAHYLNFVSSELLSWLYSNATLFVFPSYYEGFGFPPLEAATNGLISAVSNVSSIPEVCGDSVAYFNPYDVDEMSEIIKRCLIDENYRKELKTNLKPNLERFSWKKNAEQTYTLYQKLI